MDSERFCTFVVILLCSLLQLTPTLLSGDRAEVSNTGMLSEQWSLEGGE